MARDKQKRIILCTIPGTGTHFFKELLEDHGFDVKAIHCTDSGLKIVQDEIINGSILVTTWRDIDEIYKCWDKRVKEGRHPPRWVESAYLESWYRLFRWEPVVVSLNTDRVERLAFLSHVLGVELKADWTTVEATSYPWRVYDDNETPTPPLNKKKYDIRTDSFTEDLFTSYGFAIDIGYQGTFEEYKEWRAQKGGDICLN